MQHSIRGPSGAHRWLFCPGSVEAERHMPDVTTEYADEGTAAHWLAAMCLERNLVARGASLPEQYGKYDCEEFRDGVQVYLDYCRAIPGEHFVENRVVYDEWVPEGFGTSDFIAVHGEWVEVVDLKFGKGVLVPAKENWQGRLYAVGALKFLQALYPGLKYIRIHIVQPRLDFIDDEEMSIEDLLALMPWVQERAALTTQPDAPRIPGEKQCQFCKARAVCRERAQANLALAIEDFGELPDPRQLSADDLAMIYSRSDEFKSWIKDIQAHCYNLALRGTPVPGTKLVMGRSDRQWRDESAVAFELELMGIPQDKIYKKKLVGLGAVEALFGSKKKAKGFLDEHTHKPPGAPTLVDISDGREAVVKNTAAEDFADEPIDSGENQE